MKASSPTSSDAPHPALRLVVLVLFLGLLGLIYAAWPRHASGQAGDGPVLPAFLLPAPTDTPIPSPTPLPSPTWPITVTPQDNATATVGPTSSTPLLQTTGSIWCRSGPGIYYEAKAALKPGDKLRVQGQYQAPDGNIFWAVETEHGTRCWVPGVYATLVQGTAMTIPLLTPPPPPPVAFVVGIERVSRCGDERGLTLWLRNAGTRLLESVDVKIEGPNNAYNYAIRFDQRDGFAWWLTCDAGGRLERLLPGEMGFITIDTARRDLSGQPITVIVKACTENKLQGLCLERRLLLPVP